MTIEQSVINIFEKYGVIIETNISNKGDIEVSVCQKIIGRTGCCDGYYNKPKLVKSQLLDSLEWVTSIGWEPYRHGDRSKERLLVMHTLSRFMTTSFIKWNTNKEGNVIVFDWREN